MYGGTSLPGIFSLARLLRCILLRERITLVHGHAAFSALANEAVLHARTLGVAAVFTDHSLFGFSDASRRARACGAGWRAVAALVRC